MTPRRRARTLSMSKRKPRHIAPVPTESAPAASRAWFERIEIPTGGRLDIGALIHELARHAFPKALAGYSFELSPGTGVRCTVTVRVGEQPLSEQVEQGRRAILQSLFALGILRPAKPAPAPAADPAPESDGAPSPPQAPQSSPSSAE